MDILQAADISNLMKMKCGTCVSMYVPTGRTGSDSRQAPLRLKNALKKAEDFLEAEGVRPPEAKEILKPAYDLINDNLFWSYQEESLGLFLSAEFSAIHKLPIKTAEFVGVSDKFYLKPLLALLQNDGGFYVLAISQKKVGLYKGSKFQIEEIPIKNITDDIDETLKYDESQFSPVSLPSGGGTRNSGMAVPGHGTPDDSKEEIVRYLRDVERDLRRYITDIHMPLVLACVEYLVPIYRDINTHPLVGDDFVPGNPDNVSAADLHKAAWNVVEPIFLKAQKDAIKKYYEMAGTGRTLKDLKKVVEAAVNRRVDTLFVALGGIRRWGTYDPETAQAELHAERKPGDEDLLDLAAIQTVLNGGSVYAVDPDQVPDDRHVAAILRY